MTPAFRSAYDIARDRFKALDRRQTARAKAAPVKQSVAKRDAKVIPFTPAEITILAPKPDDALSIHRFVMAEFREAQAKKKAIAR